MDYLIAGLGNPTKKYHLTRHNIGFLSIDLLKEYFDIPRYKKYKKSFIGNKFIDNINIILMKPVTYMNRSGSMILKALAKFKIFPENVIIIYDDIDLPLGKIRIKKKGSSAGHKGLQSIIDYIQNENFIRIRIGIDSELKQDHTTEEFVLRKFSTKEINVLKKSLKIIPEIICTIINHSVEKAMNDYN